MTPLLTKTDDPRPIAAEILHAAVHCAIQAPSGHNTQPWLFQIAQNSVELYKDRRRALPVVDPEDRALVISCGAALFNLRIAIRHFGYLAELDILAAAPGSDTLARVSVGGSMTASAAEESLFRAIPRRHTNRKPFEERAIPGELVAELRRAAEAEGALLTVIDSETKDLVADLIAEGDRVQASDPHFRKELAEWVHPSRTTSKDGIPAGAMGVPLLASFVFPLILRTFDWGDGQAAKDRQLAVGSPILAVLSTSEDGSGPWLKAGQALQRVLLTATAEGLSASFLNQPIEVAALRPRLESLTGLTGKAQLLLRFGYGPTPEQTPRRDLPDVLIPIPREVDPLRQSLP